MTKPKYSPAPIPDNEEDRLNALKRYKVLDTAPEKLLDDIAFLASQICGTPLAFISLLDQNRQWFKSHIGTDMTQVPRDISLCGHAIHSSKSFIVEDTLVDPRFKENPLVVNNPKIRFYAGSPLTTQDGYNIGTLCVVDLKPKKLTSDQIKALESLASQVISNFERRKMETELLEREQFLFQIVGKLPDLVSYTDTSFQIQYINPAFEQWFNLDSRQIIGKHIAELIGQNVFLQNKTFTEKALTGENQEFQAVIPLLVGNQTREKTVVVHLIPNIQPNGKVQGIFSIARDITPLKEAEKTAIRKGEELEAALQQSLTNEKLFRAIFDNSPIGIIQLNSKLQYVSTNAAYRSFLGYTEEELKGKSVLDLTHPDDMNISLEKAKSLPLQILRFEKRYITKAGKTVWGLVTSRSVKFGEKGETYLFAVIEDVTEIRQREFELKAAQAKLVSYAKMASLGEMAGGIAHEVNNPLAIIYAKAQLIKKDLLKPNLDINKISTGLSLIESTADRIKKIINGLRSFSRNSENDPMVPTKVSTIVEDCLSLCKERFKNHGVELKVSQIGNYSIECSPTQISQILMNLLGNAFDAVESLKEKWVSIDVSGDEKSVRIKITDSGKGIESKVIEKMMHPFFTTKEVGRGTGLGLSISKGLAEVHQGRLEYVSSEVNTCFMLELPINQKPEKQSAA